MPQLQIQVKPTNSDPPIIPATLTDPIHIKIPPHHVRGLMEFIACLATKTETLIPAILAIVECITAAAEPKTP